MTVQYQGVWSLQSAAQLQSTQRWVTDPLFENTTLLLQADDAANGSQNNTFLDSSSNSFAITRNGNTTQGSFTPFSQSPGAWSNFFNASSTYFFTPSATPLVLSGGSWTIEAWAFCIGGSGYRTVLSKRTSGTAEYEMGIDPSGYFYYYTSTVYADTTTVPLNQWVHLAVTYDGTNLRMFQNGVLTRTVAGVSAGSGTGNLAISIEAGAGGQGFPGYISNTRITKAGALYTSGFTPSSSPLTTTVSSGTVSFLSCQSNRFVDNSSNAYTLTTVGTPSIQAFSPFAPQFQWTPSVIGGSGFFDGTGDYLSAAANTALTFGTGDFTVEGWFYANALGGQPALLNNGSDAGGLVITTLSSKIYAYFVGAGNVFGSGGATLATNTWYHFAWVRSGSTHTFYLNGAVYGATYSSAGNHASTGGVGIGYSVAGTAFAAWNGYIANVRMVKGTAVYSGAFTPPIAPVTTSGPASSYSSTTNVNTTFTSTNTSLLTNFTNAGIVDGTMKNNLETVGNAQVSTAVVKYGSGSMYFDGTGDNLIAPFSQNLQLGTGDFTIEFWINASASGSFNQVVGTLVSGTEAGTWRIGNRYNSTNAMYFARGTGAGFEEAVYGNVNVNDGLWHHVACVRLAGVIYMYVDGVARTVTSGTASISGTCSSSNAFYVGYNGRDNSYITGYLDDIRVTRGVARYITSFIPPSVALPRQ